MLFPPLAVLASPYPRRCCSAIRPSPSWRRSAVLKPTPRTSDPSTPRSRRGISKATEQSIEPERPGAGSRRRPGRKHRRLSARASSVTTEDVLKQCRARLEFPLERLTGIRSRRMAGETEFSIDLAEKAVAECLARSAHAPEDIDLLICCNISRYDGPDFRFSFEPTSRRPLCGNASAWSMPSPSTSPTPAPAPSRRVHSSMLSCARASSAGRWSSAASTSPT